MKVKVNIVSAEGLFNVELMGTSDPYCVCEAGKEKLKTKTIDNDLSPVWLFEGEMNWDETSDLVFTIYDENTTLKDAYMGKYVLSKEKVSAGFKGTVALECEHAEKKGKKGGSIEIEVHAYAGIAHVQAAPRRPSISSKLERPDFTVLVWENPLLMWKAPKKSAATLAVADLAFLVYFFFEIKLMAMVCNVGLLLTFCGGLARLGGMQLKEEQVDITHAQHMIRSLFETASKTINEALSFLVKIIFWEDQGFSTMVCMAVYLLSSFLPLMSISVLLFLGLNLLFAVPVQYKMNQAVIDSKMKPGVTKVLAKKDALVAMIPKYSSLGKTN